MVGTVIVIGLVFVQVITLSRSVNSKLLLLAVAFSVYKEFTVPSTTALAADNLPLIPTPPVTTSVPVVVLLEATPSFISTEAVALVAELVPRIVSVALFVDAPLTIGTFRSPVLGTNDKFDRTRGVSVVGIEPDAVPKNG